MSPDQAAIAAALLSMLCLVLSLVIGRFTSKIVQRAEEVLSRVEQIEADLERGIRVRIAPPPSPGSTVMVDLPPARRVLSEPGESS